MMDEFLNQDELAFLTGRTKKSAQIRWLTTNGWHFATNANGYPVVCRSYCREKMSLQPQIKKSFPDFSKVA